MRDGSRACLPRLRLRLLESRIPDLLNPAGELAVAKGGGTERHEDLEANHSGWPGPRCLSGQEGRIGTKHTLIRLVVHKTCHSERSEESAFPRLLPKQIPRHYAPYVHQGELH